MGAGPFLGALTLLFVACAPRTIGQPVGAGAPPHGGTKTRGTGDRDRGAGDRDRGAGDRDRGAGDRDRGAGGADRVLADYAVAYDGVGELRIEANVDAGSERFTVERGMEDYVRDLELASPDAGSPWTKSERDGRVFLAHGCLERCRLRYRIALREAAKKLDDLDVASEEGAVLEAPPTSWLLAPEGHPDDRLRFRVRTPPGTTFVTGVFRSKEAADAWDIAHGDLWTAPFSAFGPLRVRPITAGSARVELAVTPGALTVTDAEVDAWTTNAARAVTSYFGRFPLPEALVLLVPSRGRWVGEGKTLSGGGGTIFLRLGEKAERRALEKDWVLVHEMIHLAFPSVPRAQDWAEEGLATYVEPFARARAGLVPAPLAWRSLMDGVPNGLPGPGDRGLDRTSTWGRTYWGGALFYLLADIEIRQRTDNRVGLEHALRGILAAGGDNTHRWTLDETFAAGDAATSVRVLTELHDAMGTHPHPVDLEALFQRLGLVRTGRFEVRFEDHAPLARVRKAILPDATPPIPTP